MGDRIAVIWTAHVPENRNTTRHQRVRYLCDNYDCHVFTTSEQVPSIFEQQGETTTASQGSLLSGAFVLLLALYQVCLVGRSDYRAVHTSYHPPAAVVGFICKLAGYRWIHDVWDHPALLVSKLPDQRTGLLDQVRATIDTVMYRIADKVVAFADVIVLGMHTDAATVIGLPEQGIFPVPNGTDLDVYDGIDGTSDGPFTVLYIGIVISERGIGTTLEAIESLAGEIDNLSLVLVGEVPGGEKPWLERQIEHHGLSDTVDVTGRVSHEEALQLIADADVGLCPFPRRVELEYIYPIKLFEYMALGAVPVSSNLTGIADVIDDGDDGFLFEPDDSDELAEILARLEEDQDCRNRVARRASESVEAYDWSRINERFGTAVEAALADSEST